MCSLTFNTKKRISIGANIRPVGDLAGPRPRRFIRFRDGGRESSNFFNEFYGRPMGPRPAGVARGVSRSCSRCGERRARPGVSPSRPARRPARGKWSRHDTHAHGHVGQDPGASSSSSYRLHTHATRMSQRPSSFFARSARANLRFRSRKPLFVGHAASAAPHRDDIISP